MYYELQSEPETENKETRIQKITRQGIQSINTSNRRVTKEGLDKRNIIYKTHNLRSRKT